MAVSNIFSLTAPNTQLQQATRIAAPTPNEAHGKFGDFLKKSIAEVNEAQVTGDILTEKLARGENVDLPQVLIATQKASISLNTVLEVRNKVVEAYQEVMRMQV